MLSEALSDVQARERSPKGSSDRDLSDPADLP